MDVPFGASFKLPQPFLALVTFCRLGSKYASDMVGLLEHSLDLTMWKIESKISETI